MIPDSALNIWEHTKNSLYPLYEKRTAGLAEEMDCHAQAAEIYAPFCSRDDRILDAAGGSGYFYWSLARRGLLGRYHLSDQTADFIEIAKRHLPANLDGGSFIIAPIQQTPGQYQAVFCLNALFCLPDYRQGLERLLSSTKKIIIIRTALADKTEIRYESDDYLDPGAENLRAYFNIWKFEEVAEFISSYHFNVFTVTDSRTQDQPEISAGKIFPWRWLIGISGDIKTPDNFRRVV